MAVSDMDVVTNGGSAFAATGAGAAAVAGASVSRFLGLVAAASGTRLWPRSTRSRTALNSSSAGVGSGGGGAACTGRSRAGCDAIRRSGTTTAGGWAASSPLLKSSMPAAYAGWAAGEVGWAGCSGFNGDAAPGGTADCDG